MFDCENWIRIMDLDIEKIKVIDKRILDAVRAGKVKNRKDRKQYRPREQVHLDSLCAEYAFSRYAGIRWNKSDFDSRHEGDCEFHIEIVNSDNPDFGLLRNMNEVISDRPYVCVKSNLHPFYQFRGWAWGRDLKKKPAANPKLHDMYLIPLEQLKPIDELLEIIEHWKLTRDQKNNTAPPQQGAINAKTENEAYR